MQKLTVYGADWCADCTSLKRKLDNLGLNYQYKNVDEPAIKEHIQQATEGSQTIPVLQIDDAYYIEPSNAQLVDLLHIEMTKELHMYDVLMIGAGPTSLAAAVYTSREDIDTVLVEKGVIGGLAAITDKVDNYPGFDEGIEGMQLAEKLQKQAERFGAKIELDEVQHIEKKSDYFVVTTAMQEMQAKTILIGTGSEWKKLNIPGESEFYGRGVHNCATCDGAFYRDKRLIVVGSGNSSAQEALFLTKFASHIDILIRGDAWKASEVLIKEINSNSKITVHFNTTTDEIIGGERDGMHKVVGVKATKDGVQTTFDVDGVFVFIGLKPVTYFLDGLGVEFDEAGFVKTDLKLMTNVPGLFCAGDVRSGATMQIASAVGEGATAALSIREYLQTLR